MPGLREAVDSAQALVAKAKSLESDANAEDAEELRAMLADLQAAVDRRVGRRDPRSHARSRRTCFLPRRRVTHRGRSFAESLNMSDI